MEAFDIRNIQPTHNVLVVGQRGSGKSTLIQDILYNLKDEFGECLAILGKDQNRLAYMADASVEHLPWDSAFFKAGLLFDDRLRDTRANRTSNRCIVLDGCLLPDAYRSESIKDLLMNGRHRHTFFIHSVEHISYIPKSLRGQLDYTFDVGPYRDENLQRVPDGREGYSAKVTHCKHPDTPMEYTAKPDNPPFMLGF